MIPAFIRVISAAAERLSSKRLRPAVVLLAWLLPLVGLLVSIQPAHAQLPGRLRDALKSVASGELSLSKLTSEQPLSTSLKDVVLDVPLLDGHNPAYRSIDTLQPAAGGGWQLQPGSYALVARSYCLQPGTLGPSRDWGPGYAYAPLKGPQAATIRAILQNSAKFPDIPQQKIQLLLWRIIARATFRDLSRDEQETAALLLTSAQLAGLERGALESVPRERLQRLLDSAPAGVRQVLESEARMRELFASGAGYEDLERIAVLAGGPQQPSRIAEGRWSYHQGGYFIRYGSDEYKKTSIQIDVPGTIDIETDSLGRIASLADRADGRLLRVSYDDSIAAAPYPGAPAVRAYRIQSAHYEVAGASGRPPGVNGDVTDGIAFIGVPPNGRPSATRLSARYEFARNAAASASRVLSSLGRRPDEQRLGMLTNLVHLDAGLAMMLRRSSQPDDPMFAVLDLVVDAWQYTLCQAAGDCPAAGRVTTEYARGSRALPVLARASISAPYRFGFARTEPRYLTDSRARLTALQAGGGGFDPTDGAATPGVEGAQRLGQSSVSHDNDRLVGGFQQGRRAAETLPPEAAGESGCRFPCW